MHHNQKGLSIQVEQLSLEEWTNRNSLLEEQINKDSLLQTHSCTLFWAKDKQDIRLLFYSNNKSIRALEFMDYLVQEYVLVQGDETIAQAVLTPILLQSMMSEFEADNVEQLLEKITETYFSKCAWIYATEYAKEHKEMILQMPRYVKKKVTWAFVKTTDIVEEGKTFYLKSLENESEITLEASPDLYVMIGGRGEIYHIRRTRFEEIYETKEEPIDIFEQMFQYLPEVRACETGEFITLDEIACVCWPKVTKGIYAVSLDCRTKVFNPYNVGEYFVGRKEDYLAIRQDDLSDIYIIKHSIFHETYERAE